MNKVKLIISHYDERVYGLGDPPEWTWDEEIHTVVILGDGVNNFWVNINDEDKENNFVIDINNELILLPNIDALKKLRDCIVIENTTLDYFNDYLSFEVDEENIKKCFGERAEYDPLTNTYTINEKMGGEK